MSYRLLYPETARAQIRSLHPEIKPVLKVRIGDLKQHPYQGKALERELSGYYSLRTRRFRTIYRIDHPNRVVEVHFVGPRKDIYERFQDLLSQQEG